MGACDRVAQSAGRDNEIWTLLNSLRTLFAESSYAYEHGEKPHPCRGCLESFFAHPTAECHGWY